MSMTRCTASKNTLYFLYLPWLSPSELLREINLVGRLRAYCFPRTCLMVVKQTIIYNGTKIKQKTNFVASRASTTHLHKAVQVGGEHLRSRTFEKIVYYVYVIDIDPPPSSDCHFEENFLQLCTP